MKRFLIQFYIIVMLSFSAGNSAKYFLWLHYFDPHDPYYSKSPWIERYAPNASTKNLNLSNKMMTELSGLIPTLIKDPQAVYNLKALYDSEDKEKLKSMGYIQ